MGALVASKVERVYRVSVNRQFGRWPTAPKGSSIHDVSEFLAREAGATLYLYTHHSARPVSGEWTGEKPLEVLQRFIDAAGLRLVVQDDLWLILRKEPLEHFELSIFASRLDTERFRPGIESNDALERDLLRALPVQDGAFDGAVHVGVSYAPLSSEGPDVYLVLGSAYRSMVAREGRAIWAFKVRAIQKGPGFEVECLWPASVRVNGPVVDIREDFDGDGYRDFVFHTEDPEDGPDVILSGRDGHQLAAFLGSTLAVEKAPTGPKRFVAGMAWEELGGARLFEFELENRHFEARGVDQARKQKVERARSQSSYLTTMEEQAEAAKKTKISKEAGRSKTAAETFGEYQTGELLRGSVGAVEKVRVYYMPGARHGVRSSFEEVQVPQVPWDLTLTPERIRAGSPARILYSFSVPAPGEKKPDLQ
jgi:hypothetical protein